MTHLWVLRVGDLLELARVQGVLPCCAPPCTGELRRMPGCFAVQCAVAVYGQTRHQPVPIHSLMPAAVVAM